jgi:hypothetical protein
MTSRWISDFPCFGEEDAPWGNFSFW